MAKTIVGLYDNQTTARRVVSELEKAGFGKDHFQVASHDENDLTGYEMSRTDNTLDVLTRYGVDEDEAHFYAEAVRRGGSLVIARVHDTDSEKAVDIMARHNPVRYEDRAKAYQKEGFKGYDTTAKPFTREQRLAEQQRYAGEQQQRLKEIEENLKIGKREVVRGGVRVHKYVDTERIEETLRLREEHVDVDRQKVDRIAKPGEVEAAFKEKTIEMVERAEEAVVEKEARVTGEVRVGKNVEMREETVGGTVRRTRIEVEQLDKTELTAAEPEFREHYEQTFRKGGQAYDRYRPAYEYGYAAGTAYQDREFDEVERDLATDYNTRYKDDDSTWDNVKDAVRHGYYQAKHALTH